MPIGALNATTVDAEDIARFSAIAAQWWDENGKFKPLHKMNPLRIQFIRDQACAHFGREISSEVLKGLRVLDIGCGGGLLCEPLTRLGAQVMGIDAAEKNIKVAQAHAEKSGLAIDYRCTTAEALGEDGFDVVLALEIVEHVADIDLFMKSVCGKVKPGGLLIMSTLNRTLKSYALAIVGAEYVMRWLPRGTHDWNKFLRPSELAGYIRKCGMTLKEQRGMTYNPLRDTFSLSTADLDVNYLVTAVK